MGRSEIISFWATKKSFQSKNWIVKKKIQYNALSLSRSQKCNYWVNRKFALRLLRKLIFFDNFKWFKCSLLFTYFLSNRFKLLDKKVRIHIFVPWFQRFDYFSLRYIFLENNISEERNNQTSGTRVIYSFFLGDLRII